MTGAPRVAVVGVRRRRQGLGLHLSRFLVRHGAEVVAFVGTSLESVAEAREQLRDHGIDARGFLSLEQLRAEVSIDALVVASPAATHVAYLEQALFGRLHALCEKPLVWEAPPDAERAERLERDFAARGVVLTENCQWPKTLEAFAELHPGALDAPVRTLEMWLGPAATGLPMLVDSLSHPLSLLQALAPGDEPRVEGIAFSTLEPHPRKLDVSFRYLPGSGGSREGVDVTVRLSTWPRQPRPAGYAVNGLRAERRVRMEDYAFSFEDGDRSVPVPDPTERLVREFVEDVKAAAERGGVPPARGPERRGLGRRLRLLEQVVEAYAAATGDT